MEVVYAIGAQMLQLGGKAASDEEGRAILQSLVASGKGLTKFKQFVKAQGGATSWIGKKPLTKAKHVFTACSTEAGYISAVHGRNLGEIAMTMGAGRARKEDAIDPNVGIRLYKELYDSVHIGDPLFTLYGDKDEDMAALAQKAADQILILPYEEAHKEPVVSEIITD